MKKAMFLVGGSCWFLFALGFGYILVQYIADGAGLPSAALGVSSGSVLIGLVQVVGLVVAAVLCFAIGAGLCAHGLVRPGEPFGKALEEDTGRRVPPRGPL